MQPQTLAILITILPLFVTNAVFLLSAYQGYIPWCNPYIDGCTTISRAARSGDSIFFFRATMMVYSVLLILFWFYARQWLNLLDGHRTKIAHTIFWLGILGALSLIIYIDFLGTTGEVNRFMRRHGIMIYFTFTPLAQLLLLKQHYNFLLPAAERIKIAESIKPGTLRFQLIVLMIMLIIGIISTGLEITQNKTDISENIVEWNFAFLMHLYFAGMIFIWKDYRYSLINNTARR